MPSREPLPQQEPDDPMEAGVLNLIKVIEADMEQRLGWDAPHSLWMIYRNVHPIESVGVAVEFEASPLHFWTPQDMRLESPSILIESLARGLRKKAPAGIVPETLQAWVFVSEAWGLLADSQSDLDKEAAKGPIVKHPERVEIRNIVAIDRAERMYVLARMRGQKDAERAFGVYDINEAFGGAVPDALVDLLRATVTI